MSHILEDFLLARRQRRQDAGAEELVTGLLGTAGTPGQFQLPPDLAGPQIQPSGGTGLLADVNDPNRQATFAAGLLGNQQLRQVGGSLLAGVFGDQGAMDRQKSSNAASFRRSQLSSATQLTNAQLQREQQASQFRETFQQKAQAEIQKRRQELVSGQRAAPATGFERIILPDGNAADVMIPGSAPYQAAQGAAIKTRDAVGLVDGVLQQLISATGFESFGEVAGQLQAITQQIRDNVRTARGFGAPQEAELKLLDEMIPDITKLGARINISAKGKIIGVYTELRRELMRSFTMQQQLAGFTDIPSLREPLGATPTDVGARAAAAGLTAVPRPEAQPFGVGQRALSLDPASAERDFFVGGG